MESIHKKFVNDLVESERLWRNAERLFIASKQVKEYRLLGRALDNLYKSVMLSISTILKFEYLYKRVVISKDNSKNLNVFFDKCASKYELKVEEVKIIKEILFLFKKRKESGFEFSKEGKVVILDDYLEVYQLDMVKLESFLKIGRKLIDSAKKGFKAL